MSSRPRASRLPRSSSSSSAPDDEDRLTRLNSLLESALTTRADSADEPSTARPSSTSRSRFSASMSSSSRMSSVEVIRIKPHEFIHVTNTNTNVTSVITGPRTYTKQDHEQLTLGPQKCITVPPRHFVIIHDPIVREATTGAPVTDEHGQFKLRHGDSEVRMTDTWPDPFPLYPGETVDGPVRPLRVVNKNEALRLRAVRPFVDDSSAALAEVAAAAASAAAATIAGGGGAGAGGAGGAGHGDETPGAPEHSTARRDVKGDAPDAAPPASAGVERVAGDEWLFLGPGTHIPRVEVEEVELISAEIVKHNEALRVRARRALVDRTGTTRQAGEEYLYRAPGAFLPLCDEEIVSKVQATVLTDKTALHLSATKTFTDVYGTMRAAGQEWLVTASMATSHIRDVHENVHGAVALTTLTGRQFAVVLDPYVDGVQRLGGKELRKGECSFFLKPGESLENGIEDVVVLGEDEALLVTASEGFVDSDVANTSGTSGASAAAAATISRAAAAASADASPDAGSEGDEDWTKTSEASPAGSPEHASTEGSILRHPGDRWMVYGPREYLPPVQVDILERRKAIPLDSNEGIYVRDTKSGEVRAVIGRTYMLTPTEELWEKELPEEVETLLHRQRLGAAYLVPGAAGEDEMPERDRSAVVTFRVPHNAAAQVYDYGRKKARIVFGPDLVMLGPDEQFTVVRLSGDKPKRPNVITSLVLMLGPDFFTDVVSVETSDHARLSLQLSYNWCFDVDRSDPAQTARLFAVRDFVGDSCKALASRVRGAVAAESFDSFHKHSARIIRSSVFGLYDDGRVRDQFVFESNGLVITNVDVQSVEPVDERTRESLQKSVQLAIEITTNSQESRAKHEAKREEEEAKGLLERQQLKNKAEAEESRRALLGLVAESRAVETQGQAKAEAAAVAEANRIKGEADVMQAELRAKAMRIERTAALETSMAEHEAHIAHQKALDELELDKARKLAEIETSKFGAMVSAIGASTLAEMARAGPEMQAKLLGGLGLQSMLITDGKSPINLFQTASGMIAGAGGHAPMAPPPPPAARGGAGDE